MRHGGIEPQDRSTIMTLKTTVKVVLISSILAVAACGTGPATLGGDPASSEIAFHDPSMTMPDYSVRGMSGVIITGFGSF